MISRKTASRPRLGKAPSPLEVADPARERCPLVEQAYDLGVHRVYASPQLGHLGLVNGALPACRLQLFSGLFS